MRVITILKGQRVSMSVDCEAAATARANVPEDGSLSVAKAQEMAEFFKTLADANRLRLLAALTKQEACVSDLATLVAMSESAVSHQLRLLRMMRLVRSRKVGRKVFYSLDDNHILDLYQTVKAHLEENKDA